MAVPSPEEDFEFCPQLVLFKANYIDIQLMCSLLSVSNETINERSLSGI